MNDCFKIFYNSPLPQTITDLETGNILIVNDAFISITGFSKEQVIGKRADKFGSWESFEDDILIPLRRDGYIRQKPVVIKDKDGNDVRGLFNAEIIEHEGRKVFLSYAIDTGLQSKTEKALEKERIKSRNYFELSPNLTVILDNKGMVVEINDAGCKVLEGDKKSIIGKNWFTEFLPKSIQDDMHDRYLKIINNQTTNKDQFPDGFVNEILTLSGSIKIIEWYNAELRDENGQIKYVYSNGIDITEKSLLQEQLHQAAKLEAIGLLAGGIAHDFNNILTVIHGYSDMIIRKLNRHSDDRKADDLCNYVLEKMKKIDTNSKRAEGITRQLLAFGRKQLMKPEVVNANTLLLEDQTMFKFIREDIEISYFLDENLGNIFIDKIQFHSIIMNLLINARDAIKGTGNITLETKNIYFDEHHVERKKRLIEKGRYVMVAVVDDGIGMDKNTLSRIFEPFFTTKELGKGVGLGLSTVYGIVKQSGGYIWVYSESDEGTTFKLYFPRVDKEIDHHKKEKIDITDYTGTETILVVEDEADVREIVTETLRELGYKVYIARNGIDALELIQTNKVKINLLLTDVVMPKMDGRELAIQLTEAMPHVYVLYMSGYTDNTIVHRGILDPGTQFIQKPVTPIALAIKVREVLDNGGTKLME